MVFTSFDNNPDWRRDEEAYKDLNEIQDVIRYHSRFIRQGMLRQHISGYASELWNYFKWLEPHLIDRLKSKHGKTVDEVGLRFCQVIEELLRKSDNKLAEGMQCSSDDTLLRQAFVIMEIIERELNKSLTKIGMSVRNFSNNLTSNAKLLEDGVL